MYKRLLVPEHGSEKVPLLAGTLPEFKPNKAFCTMVIDDAASHELVVKLPHVPLGVP